AWSVQIRRKGYPVSNASFPTKAEAHAWPRDHDTPSAKQGALRNSRKLRSLSLGDILTRCIHEVAPRKRSDESERIRLLKILKDPICEVSVADLTPNPLASFRDRRSLEVKPGTLRREISLIHHALDIARLDWGIDIKQNPASKLRLPRLNNARDRRIE